MLKKILIATATLTLAACSGEMDHSEMNHNKMQLEHSKDKKAAINYSEQLKRSKRNRAKY